jgi:hypothetical protein
VNTSALQRWVDELLALSAQQWLVRLVSVAAPLAAMVAAGVAGDGVWPFGLAVVGVVAVASSLRPDRHTALFVIVVVAWHWMVAVDDIATVWLPVAAVCLLVFHTATALAASVPNGGNLPAVVVARWAGRAGLVAFAVVAMWGLVVVFDRREAAGNGALTGLALVLVALAAAFIRTRSLPAADGDRTAPTDR